MAPASLRRGPGDRRRAFRPVAVGWFHDPAHDAAEWVHAVGASAAEAVGAGGVDRLIEQRLEDVGSQAEMREAFRG